METAVPASAVRAPLTGPVAWGHAQFPVPTSQPGAGAHSAFEVQRAKVSQNGVLPAKVVQKPLWQSAPLLHGPQIPAPPPSTPVPEHTQESVFASQVVTGWHS